MNKSIDVTELMDRLDIMILLCDKLMKQIPDGPRPYMVTLVTKNRKYLDDIYRMLEH